MLRAVLVLACVGCASVPPRDADVRSADPITIDTEQVYGAGFTLKFSPTGVRLPISLVHGETEVFASASCPSPSLVGASIEPFETAVGGHAPPGLDAAQNFQVVTMQGPAVVQIDVVYEVPYSCNGPQSLAGTSTFTVFPSGRIVRTDLVKASTGQPITDAVMCSKTCDGMQREASLAVFWAFAAGGERFDPTDASIRIGDTVPAQFSCAQYPTHTVAIGWGADARTSQSAGGPITYAHDFFALSPTVTQEPLFTTSTVVVAPDRVGCAEMQETVQLPVQLAIGDSPLFIDGFGIYRDDETSHEGRSEIEALAGEAIHDGFAVALDLGSPNHLSITRRSGDPIEYLVQPDGGRTIIWIEHGLAEGDAVIVEAL